MILLPHTYPYYSIPFLISLFYSPLKKDNPAAVLSYQNHPPDSHIVKI